MNSIGAISFKEGDNLICKQIYVIKFSLIIFKKQKNQWLDISYLDGQMNELLDHEYRRDEEINNTTD